MGKIEKLKHYESAKEMAEDTGFAHRAVFQLWCKVNEIIDTMNELCHSTTTSQKQSRRGSSSRT